MIQYILKTLQKEEYVFIERLGSFRICLRHANIEDGIVHPPYNEVVFTQNDNEENNFALANQISRDRQCLFTEANEQITAWVDELLAALQHNKSVTYEDFGTFMLDKKGNITFESAVIPQLNSMFEGLEPINLKHFEVPSAVVVESENGEEEVEEEAMKDEEKGEEEVDEEAMKDDEEGDEEAMKDDEEGDEKVEEEAMKDEEKSEEEVDEPVGANNDSPEDMVKVDEKDDEKDEEDDEDEDDDDDDDHKKRHGLAWLWIVLLLLVVLGVLGYIFKDKLLGYYQQWKDRKQPVEQVVAPDDNADATATVDEITETEPEGADNDSPEETVSEPEPEPETYTPAVVKQSSDGKYDYIRFEKGHYYVIAGSFPNESDVVRHIRQKKLDQYSPKILKQDGVSNLRVCIGVFDTEAEAENFAKGISSGYWVLK